MLADFVITINDARKPLMVRVVVHDSVRALRSAATQYSKRHGLKDPPETGGLLGVCHRFHMANDPLVAIVRLAPPHVGAGMVAHELCHAAVWLWEIEHKFSRKVPINCNNDEWFCWVLGDLVRLTTTKLFEKGVYS